MEDFPAARLYRQAPLNAIWEGSGNVLALDVLRTLARAPAAAEGLRQELAQVMDPLRAWWTTPGASCPPLSLPPPLCSPGPNPRRTPKPAAPQSGR